MSAVPPGWARAQLGDVVAPKTATVTARDSGRPYLGLEHVEAHTTRILGTGDSGAIRGPAKPFVAGDILYARLRPYLNKVCAPDFDGIASTEFMVFSPSPALAPKFLLYLLNRPSSVAYADQHSEGIERPRIAWARMSEYEVELPPLAEQRRIVTAIEEHFSHLDAAAQSLQQARRRLDGVRRGVLAHAVAGDWPVGRLEDVLVSLRNGIFVSRPSTEAPGIPIFRISAVRPLSLDIEDIRFAQIDPEKANGYFVQEGDLLFTRYSGNSDYVGACARVPCLPRPTLHPDKLIRAVVDQSRADPTFLSIAVSIGQGRNAIEERRKTTAGQVGIAGSELKQVPVPLPPLDEQHRIVGEVERQLSIIRAMVAAANSALLRSGALCRSILEQVFTGKLFPQDWSEELASVRLEHVRVARASVSKPSRRRRVRA